MENMTVSQKLIALSKSAQFFHSERNTAFVRVKVGGHLETYPVRSEFFKNWLRRAYYSEFVKAAGSQAVEDALGLFEATSMFDGRQHTVNLRCARLETDGDIHIDMCDPDWRSIQVSAGGWSIVDDSPPFRRYATAAALADPDPGAAPVDIELLRPFVNIRNQGVWKLLVTWLVASWIPDIGHPVLVVHGEQGTAKSTLMKLLSSLVDPSVAPLRSPPQDEAQWLQAADHTWMLTLDNVTNIPQWLSDAVCRAATGEGSVKRKLYTDDGDHVVSFRRVIALTGIDVVARTSDLLDRSILLSLDPFAHGSRRTESAVFADFDTVRPVITSSLLSILGGVLRTMPKVREDVKTMGINLPRMADFAEVGIAVERVLGWPTGSFLAEYRAGIGEQNVEALSSSAVYEPLLKLVESEWAGTAQELLLALCGMTDEKIQKQPDWPKNARALTVQLKKLAPNLRAVGIEYEVVRSSGRRTLTISRQSPDICVTCVISDTGSTDQDAIRAANALQRDANEQNVTQIRRENGVFLEADDASDANDAKFAELSSGTDDEFDPVLEAIRH